MANLGKLMNFVFSGVSEGVKIAWDKKQANQKYREIISTVKLVISNQGRSSEHADAVLNVLVNLVPLGARRRNFKKLYIDSPQGWRKLPEDPEMIPYGHWH